MKQSEYNEWVKALKEEVKPSETCYTPSGQTPPVSIAMLIPLSLLVVVVCYAAARLICNIFWQGIGESDGAISFNEGRFIALIMLLINFLIVTFIAVITTFSFKLLAYITKLRNPYVGMGFSFFSVLVVCAALYLPLHDGHSLAPTDFTIFSISVRWILMFVGCLVLPLIVSLIVAGTLHKMKFCEETGKFLKKVAEAHLSWANGKEFIQALAAKDYSKLTQYVSPQMKPGVPYMVFRLFGHPKAQDAFVDVEATYEAIIGRASNKTTKTWLAYHEKLNRDNAITLYGFLPSASRKHKL